VSTLTLPKTLTPGTYENVGDVQDNFTAIKTLVNGGLDGDNLAQASAEALAVSATNVPRRGLGTNVAGVVVSSPTYTQLLRAPVVVMPSVGILHVSMLMATLLPATTSATISYAIQLNGTTARSRFGVASGASSGLLEVTGLSLAYLGTPSGAMLFTDNNDVGLGSLVSTFGYPAGDQTQPVGVFVPIAVAAGAYVVDVVGRMDTGASVLFRNGSLRVRAEGF
jgi:hypothetical protein